MPGPKRRGRTPAPLSSLALLSFGGSLFMLGCFIHSSEEDQAEIALTLGLPATAGYALSSDFDPWDAQGLFHLAAFPKLVRVAVEYEDYELVTGTWPDRELGVGEGESTSGEVGIVLTVPAGRSRTLRALGFISLGEQVEVYREMSPLSADLTAGSPLDATLALIKHEAGSISLTIRCDSGNQTAWVPIQVSLVDAKALVLWPPALLTPDQNNALKVTVKGVPVGRPYWARIILYNGIQNSSTALDVRRPTFIVGRSQDVVPVDIDIPCTF